MFNFAIAKLRATDNMFIIIISIEVYVCYLAKTFNRSHILRPQRKYEAAIHESDKYIIIAHSAFALVFDWE